MIYEILNPFYSRFTTIIVNDFYSFSAEYIVVVVVVVGGCCFFFSSHLRAAVRNSTHSCAMSLAEIPRPPLPASEGVLSTRTRRSLPCTRTRARAVDRVCEQYTRVSHAHTRTRTLIQSHTYKHTRTHLQTHAYTKTRTCTHTRRAMRLFIPTRGRDRVNWTL